MKQLFALVVVVLCALHVSLAQQIELENADRMSKEKGSSAILLRDNVRLSQGDMRIFCNAADFNKKENAFNARGNVKVTKGEAMTIFSSTLDYNGETKKGKFRENVRLVDEGDTLYTDYLDFNNADNSGYFYNGGKIVDSSVTLESKTGYYYPDESSYFFKDSVRVRNEDHTLHSDTLKYNLDREKAIVMGPTEIFGDSSYIYCEDGWYDMKNDIAQIMQNALVRRNGQIITGDSLYYDQLKGYGRGYSNVTLWDIEEHLVLKGNFAEFFEDPRRGMMTDSALFIDASDPADSLFLHADTLRMKYDSTQTYATIKAYYKAQVYSKDVQARSDSMTFLEADSVIKFFHDPVVWSDSNQITADSILLYTKDEQLDYVELFGNPMLVAYDGEDRYNQLKGGEMTGFFRNNEIYRLDAMESAQTVYYPYNDNELIGINAATCDKMSIFMKNQRVTRVKFFSKPKGVLFPLGQIPASEKFLEEFNWQQAVRPSNKMDIFSW